MQGSKRQVVSRISIEGLQLRAWMIVIADPPTVKDPGFGCAFIEYHPPTDEGPPSRTSPGPGLVDPLGTCIYRAPGVPAPSKDVFNGVLAEVRQ